MKLRITIILLGASLVLNTGCANMKSAYNGTEQSHFTNPAKVAAMNGSQNLPPIAEAPVTQETHTASPGGTGIGSMAGTSAPETWGGALSDR